MTRHWYSSAVTTGTDALSAGEREEAKTKADGGWNEATPFPFIQGTDCCGRVAAVEPGDDENTIGLRTLVRPGIRSAGKEKLAQVRPIGADRVITRDDDIVTCLGECSVDVVVDNVAGPAFGGMLKVSFDDIAADSAFLPQSIETRGQLKFTV